MINDKKRAFVHGRLGRRLRALGLSDFGQYCDLLDSDAGDAEQAMLVNAVTQMDKVTQQNAALVEEAAAAAKSMEEQTSAMAAMVGQFQLAEGFEQARPRGGMDNLRATGNPVVDRSLRTKDAGPAAPAGRPAAPARAPGSEAPPARRKVVGGSDIDWKEF